MKDAEDKKLSENLLELVNESKKLSLGDAAKKLSLDKKELYKVAEDLRRKGMLKIEARLLRDPELISTKIEGVSEEKPSREVKEEKPSREVKEEKPSREVKEEKPPREVKEEKPPREVKEEKPPTPPEGTEVPLEYKKVEPKAPQPETPSHSRKTPPEIPKTKKEKTKGVEIELDSYPVFIEQIRIPVKIVDTGDYVLHYNIKTPRIDFVTRALLDEIKRSLIGEMHIETRDILDEEKFIKLRLKFLSRSKEKITAILKNASEAYVVMLSRVVVDEMLGLGDLEYLLSDNQLEEVVVNSSKDMAWVYHKKHGWVKTNIIIPTEDMIMNYASRVAREVGREITHLNPLLDAHLITGDRVNATLFPISTAGNTITIRRFSRVPFTMVHFLDPSFNTISFDAAAFLWMCVEYELSMLIAGGTASGKTSMLNAIMTFMPANHRILTMEDTRELNLPEYLHWVPLTIRPPNPQGEGEVSMLDLIVNALRMRPDRVVVGEVRRKRETEVLFEAMHTGHSVYGTFHAEQSHEVVDRITSPPMDIPGQVMKSLHLIVTQYRNRRTGVRRTFEITEITKDEEERPSLNTLYKWHPKRDKVEALYPSVRVKEELDVFAGLSEKETADDIEGKKTVLKWLLDQKINSVNDVGRIVTEYYLDRDTVIELAGKKKKLGQETK